MAVDDRRRALLRAVALATVGTLVPRPVRAAVAVPPALRQSRFRSTVIGTTQVGEPLTLYQVGKGPCRVLILGGQHGGPEWNTAELARLLLSFFVEWPRELPPSVTLDVLPLANPDGLRLDSRQFLSGVDPNRNWGTADWTPDSFDSDGQFCPGLGGPAPFSEPETHALASLVLRRRPTLVINYHSAGSFLIGDSDGPSGELASAYARASGYWWPTDGAPLFAYSTTGTVDDWLGALGIPNLFVELTAYDDVELERNLEGVRSAIAQLA